MNAKTKPDSSCVKAEPKRFNQKIELIKVSIKKEAIVNIGKHLKRIYSITN